ncbi:MAG: hypothetical protein AAB473_03590 [Patescibacteria group bacterium]
MAATATSSRTSPSNPSVVLRAARLEAQKKQFGRTAPGNRQGLSMRPTSSNFAQDEGRFQGNSVARMRADRHAVQRYANPGASMPKLQEMSNSLRDSDTDQEEDANEIDEQEAQIADENDQAQNFQLAARARSRAKAATGDASRKMMDQGKKQLERTFSQAQAQLTESGGSLLDEGQFLEMVDTIATGKSITRATLSIFQGSMSEATKSMLEKFSLPMYKMSDAMGGPSAASTTAQAGKWASVLFFFLPFILIFLLLAFGTAADAAHGNLKNALTVLRGSL